MNVRLDSTPPTAYHPRTCEQVTKDVITRLAKAILVTYGLTFAAAMIHPPAIALLPFVTIGSVIYALAAIPGNRVPRTGGGGSSLRRASDNDYGNRESHLYETSSSYPAGYSPGSKPVRIQQNRTKPRGRNQTRTLVPDEITHAPVGRGKTVEFSSVPEGRQVRSVRESASRTSSRNIHASVGRGKTVELPSVPDVRQRRLVDESVARTSILNTHASVGRGKTAEYPSVSDVRQKRSAGASTARTSSRNTHASVGRGKTEVRPSPSVIPWGFSIVDPKVGRVEVPKDSMVNPSILRRGETGRSGTIDFSDSMVYGNPILGNPILDEYEKEKDKKRGGHAGVGTGRT